MKIEKGKIVSLGIIALGVLVCIAASLGFGLRGAGFIILYAGVPLIFIGLISLFSPISSAIISVGALIHIIVLRTLPELLAQDSGAFFLKYVGPLILIMGALYGFIEGLLKATHHEYKPPID
jgi:hypothetical protein